MLRNSLQQMLVEGATFEARHGKPCLGTVALLSRFQLAQGESTHRGVIARFVLRITLSGNNYECIGLEAPSRELLETVETSRAGPFISRIR